MPVKILTTENRVTVFLSGEIDHHNASDIRLQIDEAIQMYNPKMLKLDYGEVTFMDSSGVGLVMGRYRNIASYGGKIHVSNLSVPYYKIMKLAGLQNIAKITMREDEINAD